MEGRLPLEAVGAVVQLQVVDVVARAARGERVLRVAFAFFVLASAAFLAAFTATRAVVLSAFSFAVLASATTLEMVCSCESP